MKTFKATLLHKIFFFLSVYKIVVTTLLIDVKEGLLNLKEF